MKVKTPVFAANWKMNHGPTDAKAFMRTFLAHYARRPDRTILMEVDADVAAARLAARDCGRADNIAGRGEAYHAAVAAAFVRFAEADPQSFVRIDGNGTAAQAHGAVLAAVEPFIAARA